MKKNKDEHQTSGVERQRAARRPGSAFGFTFLFLILRVILRSDIIKQRALVRPAKTFSCTQNSLFSTNSLLPPCRNLWSDPERLLVVREQTLVSGSF